MTEIKPPQGASTSSIKLDVNVEVGVDGKVMKHLPNGTEVDGSPSQEFVRIEEGRLVAGDWLINPMTNDTHKVIEPLEGCVRIGTEGGGIVRASWQDVIDNLLLVVHI